MLTLPHLLVAARLLAVMSTSMPQVEATPELASSVSAALRVLIIQPDKACEHMPSSALTDGAFTRRGTGNLSLPTHTSVGTPVHGVTRWTCSVKSPQPALPQHRLVRCTSQWLHLWCRRRVGLLHPLHLADLPDSRRHCAADQPARQAGAHVSGR